MTESHSIAFATSGNLSIYQKLIFHFLILLVGQIKSVAGNFNTSGLRDGKGERALFSSPRGMWLNTTSGILLVAGKAWIISPYCIT